MTELDWMEEFPGAITIADTKGQIVYLNQKAVQVFEKEGGRQLLGRSIFDCHKPESGEKIEKILRTGLPNIYTIEKQGQKKLIYQAPWKIEGQVKGLVEISLEIPLKMPHFIRD